MIAGNSGMELAAEILLSGIIVTLAVFLAITRRKLLRMKRSAKEIQNSVDRDIYESMSYARRIQKATLPDIIRLQEFFEDVFIIFKPIEMVSGDFHWFSLVNGKIFLAVVDCQGHGVPGAFLSMMGNTLLNQIINEEKLFIPSEILSRINTKISHLLSGMGENSHGKEIMHMGLCMVDYDTRKIRYAGAVHSLYFVNDGKFRELEGDSHAIGAKTENDELLPFRDHEIDIKGSLVLYMTSEGFNYEEASPDEHIESLQMINLILKVGSMPFYEQQDAIIAELEKYNYRKLQTDDFTIIGVRVS